MRRLVTNLALFIIILAQLPVSAVGQEYFSCTENPKEKYLSQLQNSPLPNVSLIEVANWTSQKDQILNCLGHQLFSNFLNLNQKIVYRDTVKDSLDQSLLLDSFNREAVEQTLAFFQSSQDPVVKNFRMSIINRGQHDGFGFSMTESSSALADLPAGYVRAQGHIIMNYAIMNRDDWLFLFIHEFSHYVDPELSSAVRTAIQTFQNDPKFMVEILKKVRSVQRLSDLSTDDQQKIDLYLKTALQRGWIAEVRAWANTLTVYNSLKSDKLIDSVAWADELISHKKDDQSWTEFFAEYLSNRFFYPVGDPVYQNTLLRARSDEIEKRILVEEIK